jgi:hypothetical protein
MPWRILVSLRKDRGWIDLFLGNPFPPCFSLPDLLDMDFWMLNTPSIHLSRAAIAVLLFLPLPFIGMALHGLPCVFSPCSSHFDWVFAQLCNPHTFPLFPSPVRCSRMLDVRDLIPRSSVREHL